ncbi:MAG: TetR/AcrR family transcriptional regulator [Pseudomonadota bacterium]
MGAANRREQDRRERAEAILDAAECVFFDRGFHQTSMDEIARKARMSRALLYVYYRDKAAIMRGIMLRAAQAIERRFEAARQAGGTGLEQIGRIGQAYYAFSREQSEYFDVLTDLNTFPVPEEAGDEQMRALGECQTRITAIMVQVLRNGREDGSICARRVDDPVRTAFMLQGMLHGVIMQTRGPRYWEATPDSYPYPECDTLVQYSIHMMSEAMKNPMTDGQEV